MGVTEGSCRSIKQQSITLSGSLSLPGITLSGRGPEAPPLLRPCDPLPEAPPLTLLSLDQ